MELDPQDMSLEALGRYDIFLNHRGPDVKGSFLSHLYDLLRACGCNPFLDAKSLIKGKHVLNSINEALHGVRVHLAIFSKGYVESKYCLNELCDMMKSPEKVIPIFFGVEHEHLRCIENGPFAVAFKKHLEKKRDKDVERWKNVLLEASYLTGFQLSTFKDESALKKDIVARVLRALGPTQLRPARYPIAQACGGLPLALEVIGGFLFDKGGDERLWCEAIMMLHKNEDILDRLKVSYNSLCEVEQEIFLDIVFFLAGKCKDMALEFWNSDDFFIPAYAPLCTLIDRCLVKVDENGFLTMHDLLRDMGRDVVVKKSPRNVGEQSHLCNPSSVIKVLQKNKGIEKVRGLSTSGIHKSAIGNEIVCQAEHFASLNELQILILEYCDMDGDFSKWSRELRWLQWRQSHLNELPPVLQLPNLIVLDLAYNNDLYHIWPKDFALQFPCPRLRMLNLEGCTNLQELPQHINKLSLLKILHLQSCYQLQSLPTSIGALNKLTVLNISKSGAHKLPMGMEDYKVLKNSMQVVVRPC